MRAFATLFVVLMIVLLIWFAMGKGIGCAPGGLKIGGRPSTPGGYINRNFNQVATVVPALLKPGTDAWGIGGDLDPVATWEQSPDAAVTTNKSSFKFGIYPALPGAEQGFLQMIAVDINNPSQRVGSLTYLATANIGSESDPCTLSEWSVNLPGPGLYGLTIGDDQYWFIEVQ